MKSHLSIFPFVVCTFVVIPKNPWLNSRSWRFILMFSSEFYGLNSYIEVIDEFWIDFYIWRETRDQLHFFCISSCPRTVVEENILFHWMMLALMLKINQPSMYRFIPGFSVLFHSSICLFSYQCHNVLITIALY